MIIKNLTNMNGNKVANQFEIVTPKGNYIFQSYESTIAFKSDGGWFINEDFYKFSKTTTKYNAIFFGCYDSNEFHQKVKNNEIVLLSSDKFEKMLKKL